MTALQLVQLLTQAIFVGIFVVVAARAARQPTPPSVDTAVFFGLAAIVIVESRLAAALGLSQDPLLATLNASFAMALPFFLLRLADDFAGVPRALVAIAFVALVACVAAIALFPPPRPGPVTLILTLDFAIVSLYSAGVFIRHARRGHGVTGRRLTAVAWATVLLGLAILVAGLQAVLPIPRDAGPIATNTLALACAVGYAIGFAPPRWLRRAWQEPELREFLAEAARLPRLADVPSIVRAVESGAGAALGARANVALWDEARRVLVARSEGDEPLEFGEGSLASRAFTEQRSIFVADAPRADPGGTEAYLRAGARALLVAPITAGERRLGVLRVYAPRAPLFAEDDLALVELLADQAAVVLESRALIDEAARVRAEEESTRLKEDFLSAAAHDLRTPLTTIVGQAQLLELRARRNRALETELPGISRLVREATRLRGLVGELLDTSRLERGELVGAMEPTDLVALVRQVARRLGEERPVTVEVDGESTVLGDRIRLEQLVENLVDNALKFSPAESPVTVRVRREGSTAHVEVEDRGIGIPPLDLAHIFDRFRRGSNVDDRRFAGMGLGLYICRAIAELHGGRIWAESTVGKGSVFHVALPVVTPVAEEKEVLH